jgi:hypothetical protein
MQKIKIFFSNIWRNGGGIEPLGISTPRGLKPRLSTSPAHHCNRKITYLINCAL